MYAVFAYLLAAISLLLALFITHRILRNNDLIKQLVKGFDWEERERPLGTKRD